MSETALQDLIARTRATLEQIAAEFAPAVFASSLAAEDMVLTDMILRGKLQDKIAIFTLETGRLHQETLGMLDRIKETYDYQVTPYRPEPAAVEQYVASHGLNGFYDSVELRKECCRIRKIDPLNRALAGNKSWVTGGRSQLPAPRWMCRKTTPPMAWSSSTRWPTGPRKTSGNTCAIIRCRTTRCTIRVIRRSAANPAHGRSSPAKMCVPGAGGGKTLTPRNVACMWWMAS